MHMGNHALPVKNGWVQMITAGPRCREHGAVGIAWNLGHAV